MIKYSFLILLLNLFVVGQNVAQVRIQIIAPQRNQMPSSLDAWLTNPAVIQVILTNTTVNPLQSLRFTYVATGNRLGEVFRTDDNHSLMRRFNLAPNETRIFLLEEVSHPRAVIFPKSLVNKIVRDGIPEDDYTLCTTVLDDLNQSISVSTGGCASLRVFVPDAPTLLSPAQDYVYSPNKMLRFGWTMLPSNGGSNVVYKLILKPLLAGQSPAAAFQSNPTLFESEEKSSTYLYNPADPILEYAGAVGYVWQIQSFLNDIPYGRNKGRSAIGFFTLQNKEAKTRVGLKADWVNLAVFSDGTYCFTTQTAQKIAEFQPRKGRFVRQLFTDLKPSKKIQAFANCIAAPVSKTGSLSDLIVDKKPFLSVFPHLKAVPKSATLRTRTLNYCALQNYWRYAPNESDCESKNLKVIGNKFIFTLPNKTTLTEQ